MGLDMFAFKTKDKLRKTTDFKVEAGEELHYWRQHPNLHGWMERLYRRKAGRKEMFNRVHVSLVPKDIDDLEWALRSHRLPLTSGPCFGTSLDTDLPGDLLFVDRARKALKDGYSVFYSSDW